MQCCCQAYDVAYTRAIAARAHPTQQSLDFRAASTRVGARKFDSYTPRIRLFIIYGVHEGIQLQPDSRYGSACMAPNEDSIHVSVVSPVLLLAELRRRSLLQFNAKIEPRKANGK